MHPRVKRFFSYYKPYRRLFLADVLCAAGAAALALLFPLLVRRVTNEILPNGGPDIAAAIARVGALMVALVAAQSACTLFYDWRGHAMGSMMERDMRGELFGQLQKLSFGFYDGQRTGALMSRVTSDLINLTELYHHGPEDLAVYLVKFVGALIILFSINVPLALAATALLPPMAVFTLLVGRRLKTCFRVNLERIAQVNDQVEQSLSGIRVVQSFAAEEAECAKFDRANEEFCQSRQDIYRHEAYLSTGTIAITQLINVAVVACGALSIVGGNLGVADLITFLLYVGYLVEPIPRLSFIVQQYQEGIAGFNRFMDIMELTPEIADAPDAKPLTHPKGAVEFRDVSFRYPAQRQAVFTGLSLKVEPGEYVALVGSSGVGKTTLCSLIPRFYEAGSGAVLVDGTDVREIELHSLRQAVGVVQQDVYLFPGTVLENIRYGSPGATLADVQTAAKRAGAHDFVMELPDGYQTDIGARGVRLSGGQRQRLSIARAFLKNPPILILDEATSALDSESENVIRTSLNELAQGRTTFVIAHRLSTIRGAKRILVLGEHGIAEEGTHEELLKKDGVYARLYRTAL